MKVARTALLLSVLIAACSSFGSEHASPSDSGAPPDASVSEEASVDGGDTGSDAGGIDCTTPNILVCETFDNRVNISEFFTQPPSTSTNAELLLEGPLGQRERRLKIRFGAGNVDGQVKQIFPGIKKRYEGQLTIRLSPVTDVDLGALTFRSVTGEYIVYFSVVSGRLRVKDFPTKAPDGGTVNVIDTDLRALVSTADLTIGFSVDTAAKRLVVALDEDPQPPIDGLRIPATADLTFQYGVYSTRPHTASEATYDDVRLVGAD